MALDTYLRIYFVPRPFPSFYSILLNTKVVRWRMGEMAGSAPKNAKAT